MARQKLYTEKQVSDLRERLSDLSASVLAHTRKTYYDRGYIAGRNKLRADMKLLLEPEEDRVEP